MKITLAGTNTAKLKMKRGKLVRHRRTARVMMRWGLWGDFSPLVLRLRLTLAVVSGANGVRQDKMGSKCR